MTINKQALRLTAEKAKDNFMPNFMVPTRDVLELLDELEAAEKRIAELEALTVGMEQEPVAEISQAQEYDLEGNLRHQRDIDYYQGDIDKLPVGTKLYAAPQLPHPEVVIDRQGIADRVHGKCSRIPGATFYNAAELAIDEVEAFRAAMLQGSEPVTDNTNQQFESLSRGGK